NVTSLADGDVASNIGASSNAAENLLLNRGTLQYTGGAVTTDRLFSIGSGGGTIESSGSGALNFSNTGSIVSVDETSSVSSGSASFLAGATIVSFNARDNTTQIAVGQLVTGAGIAP